MSRAHLRLVVKAFGKKHFYILEKLLQECKNEDQQYTVLAVIHGRKKDRGHIRKKYKDRCDAVMKLKSIIFDRLPFMRCIDSFDSFYNNF